MQDYCKTFDNKAAIHGGFQGDRAGETHDARHGSRWKSQDGLVLQPVRLRDRRSAVHVPSPRQKPLRTGKTHIKGEITRAGVPDTWKDAVSLYAHIVGDKTVKMGLIAVTHASEPFDYAIRVRSTASRSNDYEDLLAEVKQ